ncbi:uncharacterized protein EV154DRAFT_527817 [Mucor mucedo]|uniref:uncharacterized protein n=1 Tax=Mucor mucedo TaxID=29922 RepID=UPI0022207737|nr:uncharacterized protein EV154DRAFT_527817 [Mucor mucedo]KAI7873714.1 hypothetical protein EV154DRAFT_527817 [Mucor mucedo]
MVNDINPAQLSDIRILAVNDIYLFDKKYASSISKYFSLGVHNALKPSLLFEKYHPENGNRCFDWCIGIEVSPPHNWHSSLILCAKMLSDACESENVLDLHTAHVLAFILPIFVNGQPDCSIEDSFVHNYISPLLSSVFSSDPLLNMKWAKGKLANDSNASYKPDFQVFNLSGSVKCIVLIAEFKHSEQNSYVESDLLKLGKQMKLTLNKLISDGINNPKVCGVHREGLNLNTYVMDLISPKVYRMINVAKVKLFVNLDQISLLPRVLAHLICLKNIALETSQKIENVIVSGCATLKRPAPSPPLSWLLKNPKTKKKIRQSINQIAKRS